MVVARAAVTTPLLQRAQVAVAVVPNLVRNTVRAVGALGAHALNPVARAATNAVTVAAIRK